MVGEKIPLHEDEKYKAWVKASERVKKEHAQEKRAAQRVEKIEQAREFFRGVGRKVSEVTGVAEYRRRKEREAARKLREEHERQQREQYEAQQRAWEEAEKRKQELNAQRERERLAERERQDRKALELTMGEAGGRREYRKKAKLQFEQNRMETELALNQKLTSVEEFAAAAESGTQADVRTVEYDGEQIPVYDMKGYPVTILSHDIGYKTRDTGTEYMRIVGRGTARAVLADPAIWMEDEPTEEFFEHQSNIDENQRGNTLSTSYFDSETMGRVQDGGIMRSNLRTSAVRYGFSQVRPNSLIKIYNGDASTPRYMREDEVSYKGWNMRGTSILEQAGKNPIYNEVAMLRYDEQGKPMSPDYLITLDGKITQDTLRHAAFFKVPIVNIETEYYDGRKENETNQASSVNVEQNKEE